VLEAGHHARIGPVTATSGERRGALRHQWDGPGLRLIIAFKFLKALIEMLLGVSLLLFVSAGFAQDWTRSAAEIRHHATEAWSIALAERLIHASTVRNLLVVAVALIADATASGIEGWALQRRYRWSGWLVVGTTSSFLPFEAVAFLRHPSLSRIAFLLVNALIVAYLVRRRRLFTAAGASPEAVPPEQDQGGPRAGAA